MNQNYRHGKPTIGVLAGWQFYRTATNLSYLAPVFRGISRAARDLGCNLMLGCGMGPSASLADPLRPVWPTVSREHDFIPIGPWNTDGLIIANPLHSPARSDYAQELIASGHPTLFIGSGEAGPTIVADNAGGILEALRHLVDHGHQKIAFIAGSLDDLMGDTGDRLNAYFSGCEQYGLARDARLVAYGRHVYDGGISAMEQIIHSGVDFTAVLASNDESALGAMLALENAGRRIPEDVAVIGFDNRLDGAVHQPGLSSVHVPLFSIGYHALELLHQSIAGKAQLSGNVKIAARLVVRESCGCGPGKFLVGECIPEAARSPLRPEDQRAQLACTMARIISSQAYNLTEEACADFCLRLVNTFAASLQSGDASEFRRTLSEVLEHTAAGEDDTHIWQGAISLLGNHAGSIAAAVGTSQVSDILNEARLSISTQMQRQHRLFTVKERWTSSRLSLLTAKLLTALDEDQISAILAAYLPDMNIQTALLALYEAEGDDPVAWSVIRTVLEADAPLMRFPSREFPPAHLFQEGQPFFLTLIPLFNPTGQLGFIAFDVEHFDLYGAIAQQLGGAFHTALLYRQAAEGQRLAEEANRIKSHFLYTISHELRTPLNLIVGLSGILLEESDEGKFLLPEPVQKDVGRIHAYAQHLGGLIGDVLDLATSDAGRLHLNMELIDFGDVLHMVAESGRQLTADKGLAWHADLPSAGPWVWGDRTRLRQVVLNLINNAIKFTNRGEVRLSLEQSEGAVTVIVQDTGLGIPLEEQVAIFDEFSRSERSIALGYPGLGLGLAICKTLVEMHHGTIQVASTGIEGAGSTFSITLPAVAPPEASTGHLEVPSASQPTVLVLISGERTGERLCAHLTQSGFSVQTALMDQVEAWKSRLLGAPPDAIVLDISVDSNLGWGTLKSIKNSQLARGIPIMFYTTSSDGDSVLNLDYLTKPVELTELTQTLDQHWLTADPVHPNRTFLVVDDDPNTLELHARIIQSQSSSYRILKAQNGRDALNILYHEPVDLVLLDMQMPEMDGFDVLEAMRERDATRAIPVIVVTGKELTDTDMARLNQGVAVVLRKGLFSIDETVAHIRMALERKHRLSQDARRLVRQAMVYIHEHYADPISRRDIAQRISIAEDYLTYCFRQELGITPIKYLQRFRVNQAKRLLKTSSKSITDIAFAVGFSDSGYFSRIFHRETGLSPEEFRMAP